MNREHESQRILAEYERRDRVLPADFYSLHHLPNLFQHQEHERTLLRCLQQAGRIPLADQRVVDLGCGVGDWLRVFERLGVQQENLSGIELGESRAELARHRMPLADIHAGDATALPWPDDTFDVVFQRMMFTSILDPEMRHAAAAEMTRVAQRDGTIIWIDFFVNPRNPQVRALGRQAVRDLFPGWQVTFYRTTLAPPLARRIVPLSWTFARVLESLKVFNTFYVALLQRNR